MVGSARMKDAMDVENDRLSSLPDDVKHKIISFISIKDAIATSVLSSKWRSIWTSMPYLTFENLNHGPSISNFISNVLSHRDNETQVSSVSLVLGKRVRDDESCLEKADLCMYYPSNADAHEIVCLLQHLHTAKLLILSLGILQCLFEEREHLSSSMELIPHQTCAFANARILKFIPKLPVKVYLEVRAEEKVTEIKNYDASPGAIFPMVSHKEIKVMGDMASAQVFVKNLRLFLKECKANTNNKAQMDEHGKPQVKKHWVRELQLNLGEMVALINQSKSVALETCLIMAKFRPSSSERLQIIEWLQEMRSLFQCIEGLMTPKKDVMQPIFSRLCEDATILTNSILGWMKTRQETQDTNVLSI